MNHVYALRTLKSETQTGLTKAHVMTLNLDSPDWMTSGKFAVIQQLK